jgi:type IV secretion system protein VirD4
VVVVVAVVLLWTTGNISALVAHGQRPQASIEDMGAVAVRLVQHPGEPGAAWPAADRRLLPGATWFYATLLVLAGLTAVLLLVGWRAYQRLQAALPGVDGYGAAWATRP